MIAVTVVVFLAASVHSAEGFGLAHRGGATQSRSLTRSDVRMGPLKSLKRLVKGGDPLTDSYDYIIVGGGTAGCVLANRLSEDESKKVLVLEAGSGDFKNKNFKIPAGFLRTFRSKFDWCYESTPEENVKNREIYLCRGKVLGGSSCLNVLLYHRGNAHDYNTWAEMSGDDEWSADKVLPYFKKSEDDFRGESKYHGMGGELSVSEVRYQNPLSKTYFRACQEAGFSENPDFNDWSRPQEGYGRYQVMEKNGARCSAASGFLKPVLKRENLKVLSSATVKKINVSNLEATGVDVDVKGTSHTIGLKAGGEVLLTGGAINSPQLLMLSGIGPKEHLEQHKIPVHADIPGVGKNLQDHPASIVSYGVKPEHKGISVTSKIRIPGTQLPNPKVLLQWLVTRSGPLTSVGCDHGAFFKINEENESPDLQMRFLPARAISADGMGTFIKFRDQKQNLDGFSFQSIVTRPHSTGSVELVSNDVHHAPSIKTGYFTDERDLHTIREGLKLSRKLAKTEAFKQYVGEEVFPGEHVQTDEQLNDYIRSFVHTSNALVGTCSIGTDPATSVVGSDLKVHGIKGLRVADSSVMPKIPGGQTGAPTIMIAEKAADFIMSGK